MGPQITLLILLFCFSSLSFGQEKAPEKSLDNPEKEEVESFIIKRPERKRDDFAKKLSEKKSKEEMLEEREVDKFARQKEEPRISNKWFRGSFLIYDCVKGHFACVNQVSFYKCEEQRAEDIEENRPRLRCSPFKSFKEYESCIAMNYKKMHNQLPKLYCVHPKFR